MDLNIVKTRVRSTTPTRNLAASFLKAFESGANEMHAVCLGAGSVSQGVKALAKFKEFAAAKNIRYEFDIAFTDVKLDETEKVVSGILLIVRKK